LGFFAILIIYFFKKNVRRQIAKGRRVKRDYKILNNYFKILLPSALCPLPFAS